MDREPGESNNDRNDRAIRFACNWYDGHMIDAQTKRLFNSNKQTSLTRVILLTDDVANYQKAKAEGVLVANTEEYVSSLLDHPMLIDKIAQKSSTGKENSNLVVSSSSTSESFPPHLSTNEIMEGIREKRLLQGTYQASRENYLEGMVSVEGYENPVSDQTRILFK